MLHDRDPVRARGCLSRHGDMLRARGHSVYPAVGKSPARATIARQLFAQLEPEPMRARDQRLEIDPGVDPQPPQQVDQVLGRDVAGGLRRKRAATCSAHRGVQRRYAAFHRRQGIRIARVSGVVEVRADGGAQLAGSLNKRRDLRRHADPDGVREADLIGRDGHQPLDEAEHPLVRDNTLEGAAERHADRHGDRHPVRPCARHHRQRRLQPLLRGGVLIAAAELVGGREGVMHLVHAGGDRPLVAGVVQDQARVRRAPTPVKRRHHVLRAGHLRHELGIDEACRLEALQAGRGQPVTQVRAHSRFEQPLLVLQAVPRSDVADDQAHRDKGRAASPMPAAP